MARKAMAKVKSRSGRGTYNVSRVTETDEWQCSCMGWTRHVPRVDCTHIQACKLEALGQSSKLTISWLPDGKEWLQDESGGEAKPAKKKAKKKVVVHHGLAASGRFANLDIEED